MGVMTMGSRWHTFGQGDDLSQVGRRGLRAILSSQSIRTADNRTAIYVSPAGNGLHNVRNLCNTQIYKVGSLVGNQTFSAGAVVLLGSQHGQPGELILGVAPYGMGGASQTVINASVSFGGFTSVPYSPPTTATCPAAAPGHSYLVMQQNSGTNGMEFTEYADGTPGTVLQSFDLTPWLTGGFFPYGPPSGTTLQRLHPQGDVITFLQPRHYGGSPSPGGSVSYLMVVWDLSTGNRWEADFDFSTGNGGPWALGSPPVTGPAWKAGSTELFWAVPSGSGASSALQLFKISVPIPVPNAAVTLPGAATMVGPSLSFDATDHSVAGIVAGTARVIVGDFTFDLGANVWSLDGGSSVQTDVAAPCSVAGTPSVLDLGAIRGEAPGGEDYSGIPASWTSASAQVLSAGASPSGSQGAYLLQGSATPGDSNYYLLRFTVPAPPGFGAGCAFTGIQLNPLSGVTPLALCCRD